MTIPAVLVDRLPESLWSLANLYRFFGHDLHFCVADDGKRTIEVDDREVARGDRLMPHFGHPLGDETAVLLYRYDVGWVGTMTLIALLVTAVALVMVGRRHP